MARAIRKAIRANRFARIDSRESFAIETPIFVVRQDDSHESLEFPIRANHATKFSTSLAGRRDCNSRAAGSFGKTWGVLLEESGLGKKTSHFEI